MFFSIKLSRALLTALSIAALGALCVTIFLSTSGSGAREASAQAVSQQSKAVYLTFDDGPSDNTAAVLDALERHGVRATFFVTGQRPDHFDMLAREAEAGHLVALHSYSHDFQNIYKSSGAFWEDIEQLQEVIKAQTGESAPVLRFPGGSSNTIARRGVMKSLAEECSQRGLAYYDWNVDTRDAVGSTKSADYIAERAIKGALREHTPVILMHDGPMNSTAADALDIIIPALKDKGLVFATLDELAQPVHHSLS